MNNLLEIKNLRVKVNGQELLRNVNLTVLKEKSTHLLGPNGSGKTSWLWPLWAIGIRDIKGKYLFDGEDIAGFWISRQEAIGIRRRAATAPSMVGVNCGRFYDYITAHDPRHANEWRLLVKDFEYGGRFWIVGQRGPVWWRNQALWIEGLFQRDCVLNPRQAKIGNNHYPQLLTLLKIHPGRQSARHDRWGIGCSGTQISSLTPSVDLDTMECIRCINARRKKEAMAIIAKKLIRSLLIMMNPGRDDGVGRGWCGCRRSGRSRTYLLRGFLNRFVHWPELKGWNYCPFAVA